MSVQIITDSASDITQQQAAELGIKVLPLRTIFGDEVFRDGIDMSHQEFYQKLVETDQMPTTSQIPPIEYEEAFQAVKEAGDTAVCITISATLSGCNQSANIAAEDYADCVQVVDSVNVCIGEQILVKRAIQLRDQGKNAEEIVEIINQEKSKIRLIALMDTLEYLKKGGRISSAAAFAGSLLSIKPVIAIEHGEVVIVGKARGSKNGHNLVTSLVEKEGGINFDMPYVLGYTGLSNDLLQKYVADSKRLYEGQAEPLPVSTIGSTIGTHAGPGGIAAAFFVNG